MMMKTQKDTKQAEANRLWRGDTSNSPKDNLPLTKENDKVKGNNLKDKLRDFVFSILNNEFGTNKSKAELISQFIEKELTETKKEYAKRFWKCRDEWKKMYDLANKFQKANLELTIKLKETKRQTAEKIREWLVINRFIYMNEDGQEAIGQFFKEFDAEIKNKLLKGEKDKTP